MEIKIIEHDFSVCKVADYSFVDLEKEYCFIGKTEMCIRDRSSDAPACCQ